ncbi:MAG: sugar phosphate isomerase/epimerase family protein [Blastocatellia bacterium]
MNQQQKQRRAFLTNATQAAAAIAVGGWRNKMVAAEAAGVGRAKDAQPIQIGILLGTVRSGSLAARLDAVKAVGLDCVQLSMDCAGLPMMPDEISAELARQIRREASERGITIASVAGTFNMCHPDAEHRQTGLRRLRVLAEACSQLGVKKIHLCSGTRDRTSMWRRHPDNDTPEAWRDMAASMRVAADIARQNRVILAFEPEVNNVVNSAKKARRLMDEIGSPHLKVTLDAANLFHTGELPRMKEILDEAFTLVGKDIVLAHAKDLDHDGDAGHMAAGQGKLDYDRYVGLLRKYKFPGPLLLHSLTEAQMPGCVAFLREKIGRLNAKPSAK